MPDLIELASGEQWRLCRECGTVYTDDPGRVCSDCLPDAAAKRPGSISEDQRRQIAVLLLEREPVARSESIAAYISGVIGATFTATNTLWELSAHQGADLLEALETERRGGRGLRGVDYQGKRNAGKSRRRPTQGAHRARA